jgi:serine/threonine protein kinase
MSTDFHQRMRQIFEQAVERPESERRAFVESASAGDAVLSDAVERLLRARGASESFLEATLDHTGQIGRYLIRGELGRGAMGIVYDAIDPMIGRRVAVKVISLKAGMDQADAEFLKERLFREARSAGRLFHPGIIVILDVGLHGDSAFITMEHVEGPSLHQLLSHGPPGVRFSLGILQQTAAALDYAHQNGVVHRDIKPANILLQNKTTVKVADFGIAKLMSQNATLTGMLMGTPSYMSPEQIEAQPVDGRSDQFSLAVMAYELLTGARPFQADSMATVAHLIVYGPRPSARAANPALPADVDQVLSRGLNRFPDQRYANCTEFVGALHTAVRENPPVPVQPSVPKVEPPRPAAVVAKRGAPSALLYIGAGAVLVVLGLALAAVRYENSRPRAVGPQPAAQALRKAPASPPVVVQPPPPPSSFQPYATAPRDVPPPALPASAKSPYARPETPKADAKTKVPDSLRAQELYTAAMTKRHEGKPEETAALLRQSADLGNRDAMEELGECYRTGDGVPKDGLEAERWFLRSATAGNSAAMVSLGALYWLGDDVPQNNEDAAKWFQRAADLNNPAGLFDLARFYEEGRGVPKNLDKAKQLYQQSAALGNTEAQHRLAQLQAKK